MKKALYFIGFSVCFVDRLFGMQFHSQTMQSSIKEKNLMRKYSQKKVPSVEISNLKM